MTILQLPDHRAIPRLDEPAQIVGLTVLVAVHCACGESTPLALVNGQPAACEACGAVFSVDAVRWNKGSATPQIQLSASPSRAKALSS